MADVGAATAEKEGDTGTLRTRTLKVKQVPNDKGDSENAADFHFRRPATRWAQRESKPRCTAESPVREP